MLRCNANFACFLVLLLIYKFFCVCEHRKHSLGGGADVSFKTSLSSEREVASYAAVFSVAPPLSFVGREWGNDTKNSCVGG